MVQSSYRLIQLVLLCFIWQLGTVGLGWSQHSSIRIQQEDRGEILLFLINVSVHMIGKKLDKGYKCPVYCGIEHNHYYWDNHENKESNIQAADGLYRSTRATGQEQSASSI